MQQPCYLWNNSLSAKRRRSCSFTHSQQDKSTRLLARIEIEVEKMAEQYSVPSIEESQSIVANAVASLSVADRNVVMEDLNAIRHPDRIGRLCEQVLAEHLQTMDNWLSTNKNDAYQEAERLSRDYVENVDLRYSFLQSSCIGSRTSRGDALQAAQRLNDFVDFKRRLFGSQKLVQNRMTLSDLDADDLQCLESGYWQKIGTDVAGRVIVATFPTLLRYCTSANFLRSMLVFFSSLFEETTAHSSRQDQSLVLVYYNTTPIEPDMDRGLAETASRLLDSLPIKICAHHVALHPDITRSTAVSLPLIIPSWAGAQHHQVQQRHARYIFHTGQSREEIEVKLRRYGITVDLPCNRDGSEFQLETHLQWIESIRDTVLRKPEASSSDAATTAGSVGSGSSNPSSRASSRHGAGTPSSSSSTTSGQVSRSSDKRSSVLDDSSAAMSKPSAKDILYRQLASDAKTPASAQSMQSALDDAKASVSKKRDSSSLTVQHSTSTLQHHTSTSTMATALAPASSLSHVTSIGDKRQRMDPASLTETSIILPRDSDILFGRGSGIQNHPGKYGMAGNVVKECLASFLQD
jgi:hypothetical protein